MKFTPLTLCLFGISLASPAASSTLATVNNADISSENLKQALRAIGTHGELISGQPDLKKRFLDHLIDTELRAQEATALGLDKTKEFSLRLKQAETQLLATMYAEKYRNEQAAEASLVRYFDREKELFIRRSVQTSHIFFRDLTSAESFSAKVTKHPEKFDQIAKKHFPAPDQQPSQPDEFEKGGHSIELERAAFTLPRGKVSPVIRTASGFHVIRVNEIRYHPEKHQNFNFLRSDVKRFLLRNLEEELSENLKKKAKMTINQAAVDNFRY